MPNPYKYVNKKPILEQVKNLRDALMNMSDEIWTTGCSAVDKYGEEIHPLDPKAVKFCSTGYAKKLRLNAEAISEIYYKINNVNLYVVNDVLGKEAVVLGLDNILNQESK